LIGDVQIRRVVGRMPPLDPDAVTSRADDALRCFLRLYATTQPAQGSLLDAAV
jgi:hypothetical protein